MTIISETAAKLRQLAEKQAAQMQEIPEAVTPEEARQILHELRVHQIELEMQNEELRRTQGELAASRERYFDLYDLAPVGYVTISETGLILEANLTAATLLGVIRSALVNRGLSSFIFAEDQDSYYLHRKQLLATGEPQSCDLRLIHHDGSLFWARFDATAARDAAGSPVCRAVISDISGHKRDEDVIRASLKEKEVLLGEIHHRVKNNLQLISSLINLQSYTVTDPQVLVVLKQTQSRIMAIALVHEKLYRSDNFVDIDLHGFLGDLVAMLCRSYGMAQNITLEVAAEPGIHLRMDEVNPFGLIVTELFCNCLKYAFPDNRPGTIVIEMARRLGTIRLCVRDNGVGLPEGFDPARSSTLGYQLITSLTQQIGATLTIESVGGTSAVITWPHPG
jgi:PAS domain S-box-containing protein